MTDNVMRTLLNAAIYIALVATILPWFLLVLPVAGTAFVLLYAVFRVGIGRLQRLQLESMAPLLTHVDASVHGLASVHAYDRLEDFQSRSVAHSLSPGHPQPQFSGSTASPLLPPHAVVTITIRLRLDGHSMPV